MKKSKGKRTREEDDISEDINEERRSKRRNDQWFDSDEARHSLSMSTYVSCFMGEGITSLPSILAETLGRDMEDIYRGSDQGILKDVELLQQITEASRGAVSAFVEKSTNKKGQVVDVGGKLTAILGFGLNEPWIQYLSNTEFYRTEREKLRTLFKFLGVCLKLIVADNELGSLKQALEGKYVEPGPGGDPIRNPKVLPTGKNIHALDPQSIPTATTLQSAKVVVDRLLERQKADNGGKYHETVV